VTQILELALLAPDIQKEILFAEAVDAVEPLIEQWPPRRHSNRDTTAPTL
jgi:hypothetical protein